MSLWALLGALSRICEHDGPQTCAGRVEARALDDTVNIERVLANVLEGIARESDGSLDTLSMVDFWLEFATFDFNASAWYQIISSR